LFFLDPLRYDAERPQDALVWSGSAVGCSKISDLGMTGQMLLLMLLRDLHPSTNIIYPKSWLGVSGTVLTPDGKVTYPTILRIAKDTPAATAGLREWDVIWEIDGKSTANMTFSEAKDLLSGNFGDTRRFTIRRLDKTIELNLKLVPFRQSDVGP
jgi:S1-C subfamily serine protease